MLTIENLKAKIEEKEILKVRLYLKVYQVDMVITLTGA